MTDHNADREAAAWLLARNGLTASEFDPAETAELLAAWGEADAQLDLLLEQAPPGWQTDDPTGFRPDWR